LKSKEDLFHLIKALSRSEKRYFTLDAQKSGKKESKYLELFQAINEEEDYDESALRNQFGAGLASDKTYLYEAILRSMRDYHSARSLSARLKEWMLDARFLYERGLFEQSEQRLLDALELAVLLDDRLTLLEINIQHRHLVKSMRKKDYRDTLKALVRAKEGHIEAVNQELLYRDIGDELFLEILQFFELKNEAQKTELRNRFPMLSMPVGELASAKARWRYLLCMAMYHQLLGDFDEVFRYYRQVVDWWDNHPKYKQEEFYFYIIDVSNLLHAFSVREQYHLIPEILDKLAGEEPNSLHTQSLLFQKSAVYRLMYLINMGVTEGEVRFVTEMEKGLEKYEIKAGTRNALIINVAILLFIQGKFQACVKWVQKVIRDKSGARADILFGAWVLQLPATLSYADPDELESVHRATARFFTKKGTVPPGSFEMRMLEYAKRLAQCAPSDEKLLLKEWIHYLEEISTMPGKRPPMGLDELVLYWLRSRVDKVSIIQQIQRKIKQIH
jgi:hypothetical protein